MKTESLIRILAGSLVLLSLALAQFVNHYWLFLATFVGINLIQSAFTNFCPAESIFKKLGIAKDGGACCAPSEKAVP